MLVQDYIARMIKINDYLEEFPPVIAGRNSTKLPDNELLDLLEFGIPIKWQQKMQVQNVEPTAWTLRDFQDLCERQESASDDPPLDNKSNKTSGQEKSNKKRCWDNNNNKDKKYKQCRTLKKEAEKHKKGHKNGNCKNTKRRYNPSKEEINTLAAFSKEAIAKDYENVNK